jgi:hypothetical protein
MFRNQVTALSTRSKQMSIEQTQSFFERAKSQERRRLGQEVERSYRQFFHVCTYFAFPSI